MIIRVEGNAYSFEYDEENMRTICNLLGVAKCFNFSTPILYCGLGVTRQKRGTAPREKTYWVQG